MSRYKKLGLNIKKYRKAAGLSQEKLAEYANLSRKYICELENAVYSPSIKTVFALADALKIEPKELFDFN